ncbi:MAG: hypothetical protein ACRCZP_10445, partial [Phycicoccus sp.]
METIYAAAGGRDGLLALARAWHARCLADDLLEHPDTDERGVELFDGAMDDVGLTEPRLRGALHGYFAWSVRRT